MKKIVATNISEELERRNGNTRKVAELLMSKPLVWIAWSDFTEPGGACAWRTRLSNCRQLFKKHGLGDVEWNGNVRASKYRYVPFQKLGRSAETEISGQRSLLPGRSF